ncbi:MAG: hypothetical protein ABEJ35_06005 [Halobacteriaceae archaeon]
MVAGTIGVVAFGSDVLAGARGDSQIESAEQAMTKFDATAALVALGRSETKRAQVSLRDTDENLNVNPDQGWMRIRIVNQSTGNTLNTLKNVTLGSVVYSRGETKIGYQGGGVWKQTDGGSTMVSPPEFHYRGNTLTLPIITVSDKSSDIYTGNIVLESSGTRNQVYPNASAGLLNPLPEEKQVNVTVHSEYYDAWARFFAQRTDGSVTYDHPNETVTVELVVPFDVPFSEPLIATDPGGVQINGNCDPGGGNGNGNGNGNPGGGNGNGNGNGNTGCGDLYISGVDHSSPDQEVESQINTCETDAGACEEKSATGIDTLGDGKTYFFPDGIDDGEFTVDTSNGNVTLVVDGDMTATDINVDGDKSVKVYLKGDLTSGGDAYVNSASDNKATQFLMFIHSTGTIDFNGKVYFKGLIYAPGSEADFNGVGTFAGSIVAETIDVNGAPSNTYNYPGLNDINLNVGTGTAFVNYLYISTVDIKINQTGAA